MSDNDTPDRVTPDMIGRVVIDLNVDCLFIAADVTRNGVTTTVTFDDPDIVVDVTSAIFLASTDGMLDAAATALVNNGDAECHMYQTVF